MPKGKHNNHHNKNKTHCPRGHDYRSRGNQRWCPMCQKGRRVFGSTAAYDAALAKPKVRAGSIRLGWDEGDDPCEYRQS